MDLRFYRTGTIAKAPIHPQDIADIVALLRAACSRRQIYVAGELSDPHGTHRDLCRGDFRGRARRCAARASILRSGCIAAPGRNGSRTRSKRVVPLSPDDLERKKQAIFRHQSQKDRAMFPGGTRPPRVLAAGRGPQPPHRQGLRQARACRSFTPWRALCSGAGK